MLSSYTCQQKGVAAMWIEFAIAMLLLLSFLYLPGFLLSHSLGLRPMRAICFAPAMSVFFYTILANVAPLVGFTSSGISMFVCVLGIAVIASACSIIVKKSNRTLNCEQQCDIPFWSIALYVGIGSLVVTLVFVRNLDGAGSFLQEIDNVFHLGLIKIFAETGDYSFFGNTLYSGSDVQFLPPSELTAGFYPAAWHCLSAMVVSTLDCSIAMSANVVNTAMAGIVFPLSMCSLIYTLFDRSGKLQFCGSLCVMAAGAFPWVFLLFGPLYPNLMSYALLPLALSSFVDCFAPKVSVRSRMIAAASFVCAMVAIAASQPNAVFTAAVFLAPFCIWQVGRVSERLNISLRKRAAVRLSLMAIASFVIAAIWFAFYSMPAFQEVVTFNWAATNTPAQAVVNVLTLGLTFHTAAQVLFGIAVFVGLFKALFSRRYRWMVVSYLLAAIIYIVSTSSEGFAKSLLAGFWYTDPFRLSATVGLFAIPFAALGLSQFVSLALRMLKKKVNLGYRPVFVCSLAILSCLWLACVFFPNFTLPGYFSVDTAFSVVRAHVREQNDQKATNVLDADERSFIQKAMEIIPSGSLVLNEPNDGSAFAYSLYDMNIYYRYLTVDGVETSMSQVMRTSLADYTENPAVQQAVKDLGVEYVLILDQGGEQSDQRRFLGVYYPEQWVGFNKITDETPGFEVVLAEGDMRLYRIEQP